MKPFKRNVINVIYLDTKKITRLTWKYCMRLFQKLSVMPCGCPATGQEEYMHIKLHKDTYRLWTERERLLQLKSNNEVTLHFLNLPSVSSSAVCVRSQEHRKIPVASPLSSLGTGIYLKWEETVNLQKTYVQQSQMFPLLAGFQLEMAWKMLPSALSLGIYLLRKCNNEYATT